MWGASRPIIEGSDNPCGMFPLPCRNRDEARSVGCRRGPRCPGRETRLKQRRDQTGPAGLVRRAEAAPGIAVEIFVEQHMVAEAGILLLKAGVTEKRPASGLVEQKD